MFHAPDYYQNVSLRLSEVFNDMGVSERSVTKRRRAILLSETTSTITNRLIDHKTCTYIFGSQSEGTTTSGLDSDLDALFCSTDISVMQNWAEWSRCKVNLLMIQDDTTPPGYCNLQCIRGDVPLPDTGEYGNHFVKDTHGRVLMKNTVIDDFLLEDQQRQGPSMAIQGGQGIFDRDIIFAYPFKSLPQSVRHWLDREHSVWPNAEMKRYAANSDCFVVPTGGSVSENKDFHWRISTSLAERCFMFNLNITQIRCYILLKMILKTYINLHGQKTITSYMCKTVLFHCIRSKPSHVWKERNILNWLLYCLSTLNQCIKCSNCPHFIIPGNNLMAGKINAENKNQLLEKMSDLIRHPAGSLLGIQIDDLGQRLLLKLDIIHGADYYDVFSAKNTEITLAHAHLQSMHTARSFDTMHLRYLFSLKSKSLEAQMLFLGQTLANTIRYHNEGNVFVQTACQLLTPTFYTTLGSLMASYNIQHNNRVSPQAFGWLSAGINSDVSSGRLKLASVLYCTGNMERTVPILRDTEERYNIQVVCPVCACYILEGPILKIGFSIIATHYNEDAVKYITAFCVRFLPSEINCIPKELQYEMFKSTREELLHRSRHDVWMELATVDSIPYLYFLQYKTYSYLQRIQDQQRALCNLLLVTLSEEMLSHRETAWNLLGQCMEQENRLNDALQCYRNSLHIRQTNNVARVHICMLLARQFLLARENNLMFHTPDYYQNISLRLSEVFSDMGVSERSVTKIRRVFFLLETTSTITHRLLDHKTCTYIFGSQSEGTTTSGLESDLDALYCCTDISVMQNWAEWSRCKVNLLMIQDDTTPPGYCNLQCIRGDVPLPDTWEYGNHFVKDTHGRLLMKNTVIDDFLLENQQRQGPSMAIQGGQGILDRDIIISYSFKSLPQSVRHWLDQEHSVWPNAEMKRYAANSDCFVVPTGGSVSENKDFHWRISTSLAERCFMFNLNITQIRCYIILKMILKTYINLHGQKIITSYMCKTVLFHCIRSKPSHVWKESNILNWLLYCLSTLNQCIKCSNCPHFIIPGNNLMAGKITAENKKQLLEKMSDFIRHPVGSLLGIQIDDLGQRLLLKLDIIHGADYYDVFSAKNTEITLAHAHIQSMHTARTLDTMHLKCLFSLKNRSLEAQILFLVQTLANAVRYQNEGNVFVQTACQLLTPIFCTRLGSLMASYNIQHNNRVSPQAFGWLSAGINSDVSSGRLKLASVLYCTGNMERTVPILRDTEERYNIQVVCPVCTCYILEGPILKIGFSIIATHYNEDAVKYITAFCVRFLPSEINCIPKELQYEMFKSTREELLHRSRHDVWMELATVDSIPYLYFLQYKTYGYLQRIQDQQGALRNLLVVTLSEEALTHRETAWNLLGQCMEQENRLNDALQCYRNSLHIRQTNNVARVHICMLLARQFLLARENNL